MRTFTTKTMMYIFTLICMLLIIELFLQLAEIDLTYHELDPYIGKKLQKNARIIMLKEGFYLGKSNEFGYLGPGYPQEKKENEFRIVLMGDSFTEGFQLFEKYHFGRIMEEQLNKNSNKEVHVLNFGVGGYNFYDMYINYLNYASSFKADLVMFIVRPNDMTVNQTNYIPAPYFYLENDRLKINYDFRHSSRYKIYKRYHLFFENSSFLKMLNNAYKLAKKGYMPEILFDKFYTKLYLPIKKSKKKKKVNRNNVTKKTKARKYSLPATTRIILDDLGKEGNTYFIYRAPFPHDIHTYIINSGIKVLNINQPLNDLRQKGINPHYWKSSKREGHWNHQAHREIGNYLANKILPSIK